MSKTLPFWKTKSLDELSTDEWESLCDHCGKCCLNKLEDEDTGEIHYTNAVCYLIDMKTCLCSRYSERQKLVPDCLKLSPKMLGRLNWMPKSCAYRLIEEGKDLPDWHPLRSNSSETVHAAGISIRSYAIIENQVDDLLDHIIDIK